MAPGVGARGRGCRGRRGRGAPYNSRGRGAAARPSIFFLNLLYKTMFVVLILFKSMIKKSLNIVVFTLYYDYEERLRCCSPTSA